MTFDIHRHTDYYSSCSAINPQDLIRRANSNSFFYLMILRALSKAMDTPIRLSPAIRPDATGMV